MNVFVLSTGRCGSTTFMAACRHITNYTSSFERNAGKLGAARTEWPSRHIAIDSRLAWFPARLHEAYGDNAFYVHLTRDPQAVALSHVPRWGFGITRAYRDGILTDLPEEVPPIDVTRDYVRTVNSNIAHYLRGRPHQMVFRLEHATEDFTAFWRAIGAEGDLEAALAVFTVRRNATPPPTTGLAGRTWNKLARILSGLPRYLREA